MNTLLSHFLPTSILQYTIHTDPNLHISHLQLRPFRSGLVATFQNIRLNDTTIHCQTAKVYYTQSILEAFHISYSIHSSIYIQTARISIAGTIVELCDIRILFSDSDGFTTITIGDIRVPSIMTIRRFDIPMNLTIRILDGIIHISIPEVRIVSHPSLRQLQRIQQWVQHILPPDDPNTSPPKIHISSIFIRHMITGWSRCISPISIGFSHTSIWEISEHIIRALTRI